MERSHTTHTPPLSVEDLGDGTYHYNFNVVETEIDGVLNFDYMQLRLKMPVNAQEIQAVINRKNIEHNVKGL